MTLALIAGGVVLYIVVVLAIAHTLRRRRRELDDFYLRLRDHGEDTPQSRHRASNEE